MHLTAYSRIIYTWYDNSIAVVRVVRVKDATNFTDATYGGAPLFYVLCDLN